MSLNRKSRSSLAICFVALMSLNVIAFGQQSPEQSSRTMVAPQAYFTEPALSPDRKRDCLYFRRRRLDRTGNRGHCLDIDLSPS